MTFASVYPHYLNKVIRKGKLEEDLKTIIIWLTGYSNAELVSIINSDISMQHFFDNAPKLNVNRRLIKGLICKIRVEEIEDPLMQNIRYLDKLVDELAHGKKMSSILRKPLT